MVNAKDHFSALIRTVLTLFSTTGLTFELQSHKVVKHTQTIRRQIADELFDFI